MEKNGWDLKVFFLGGGVVGVVWVVFGRGGVQQKWVVLDWLKPKSWEKSWESFVEK